ncbi:MAG: hypothetical protein WHS43_03905 [Aquificaceae bacterium]|uniref:hypothetical protein n=1 Tax=Hydrogenobacter sp. Uz 6-8 TaxID=3384828 RepID=UPI0030AFFD09
MEFKEGMNFIRFFEPVINVGNAVSFQRKFDLKMSENSGYSNPQRILKNCQFFSKYGKPIHSAHYMPNNERADVIVDNMDSINRLEYIKNLYGYGLRSFFLMNYDVVKGNKCGSLERLFIFRNSLKEVGL